MFANKTDKGRPLKILCIDYHDKVFAFYPVVNKASQKVFS